MKLHILGIPHTCTTHENSHCAFTGKVLRFAPMMRSVGYEVIHYGNGTSNPGASKHEIVLTEEELESYKREIMGGRCIDKNIFHSTFAKADNIIYLEFNKRLKELLRHNLEERDIICCPFGVAHEAAISEFNNLKVETGIGYNEPYLPYRIYETFSWYQFIAGKTGVQGNNYWFVIPNYFDITEWDLCLKPSKKVVYLGRLQDDKGLQVVVEIARHRPDLDITICGQGNPAPYLLYPNITYKAPIHGKERSEYLGNAMCTLMPTIYNEPFGGVTIESHLCGTPVLSTPYGSFVETIEHGFNGYRCHTLGDFLAGLDNIEKGQLNREKIRKYAVENFDMYVLAHRFAQVFQRLLDLYEGGWYSKRRYF